jgi:Calcineurin-like phosphoesterase/Purple acid Phosphatase, N-terminal domain/Iron/zinc purple acid phosphatase-like protein C
MKHSYRFPMILVGFLLILLGASLSSAQATFLVGPYPQHSNIDSIIISWETTEVTTQNEVHWGLSLALGNITKDQAILPGSFHSVKIKGLQANQKYYYIVVSDGMESLPYTFSTASEKPEPIRFIVYGDTRGSWDHWLNTLQVSQAIEKEEPAIVFNTGDLVDEGKNKEDWIDFFAASPFVHNSTLFPVLGNHENNSRLYFSYFSLPFNERWYSYENGPVHFLALDSNYRFRFRITQYLWLHYELRNNRQPFTVILFHHPPYSSGSEHGNSTWIQRFWVPIFEQYHVDVVVNGHDHDYERSIVNGVTYIVTGGGGAPLYDVGQSPWTVYSEKTYHYCVFTVNASILTFEAKKPTGDVFDSFILTK